MALQALGRARRNVGACRRFVACRSVGRGTRHNAILGLFAPTPGRADGAWGPGPMQFHPCACGVHKTIKAGVCTTRLNPALWKQTNTLYTCFQWARRALFCARGVHPCAPVILAITGAKIAAAGSLWAVMGGAKAVNLGNRAGGFLLPMGRFGAEKASF